jgi:CHAD domain-containing protein
MASSPRLGPHPDTVEVVVAVLAKGARQLARRDEGVRDGADPEDIHQARVATRRLRADLRSLRPVLDEAWTRRVRADLRWLGALLGEVRDLDVLGGHVHDQLDDTDEERRAAEVIVAVMRDQRTLRHLELVDAMTSSRYRGLLRDLAAAIEDPPLAAGVTASGNGRKVLRRAAERAWARTERAEERLTADSSLAELHEVRKRAKRARYAAQLSRATFGAPAKHLAKRLGEVQDRLGALNDAVTLISWLDRESPARLDPATAYVAGQLVERQRRRIERARSEWQDAWADVRRKDLAWLD